MEEDYCPGEKDLTKILCHLAIWEEPIEEPGTVEEEAKELKKWGIEDLFDPRNLYEGKMMLYKNHQKGDKLSYQWGKTKEEIQSKLGKHILSCEDCFKAYFSHLAISILGWKKSAKKFGKEMHYTSLVEKASKPATKEEILKEDKKFLGVLD